MNRSLLILLSLGSHAAFGLTLDFRMSRVHGLINFAETIAGDPHRSKTLREVFEKSPQAKTAEPLVEKFKKSRSRLDTGWTFPGFPADRVVGQTLEKLILVQGAFSTDLEDFSVRSQGMMPSADHAAYIAALKALAPIYDSLIWTPSLPKLTAIRDTLVLQAKQKDFNTLFGQAAAFYRAQWPEGVPITIALHPIPGAQGYSSAESLDGLQSMGVLLDKEVGGDQLGVLFHELCHSLYEAQTAEFQAEWEKYFRASSSEAAEPAYALLNEAMATALGNGWAQEKVASLRSGTWYSDPYIDVFAHELYPTVKAYVEASKPLDQAFAQKAIAVLEQAIPGAAHNLEFRLKKTLLVVEGKPELARRELQKHFTVSSLKTMASVASAGEEVKRSRASLIVVVGRDSLSELTRIEKIVSGLRVPWAAFRGRPGPVVYSVLQGHRPVILIRADGEREVTEAFSRIGKVRSLDKKASFFPPISART